MGFFVLLVIYFCCQLKKVWFFPFQTFNVRNLKNHSYFPSCNFQFTSISFLVKQNQLLTEKKELNILSYNFMLNFICDARPPSHSNKDNTIKIPQLNLSFQLSCLLASFSLVKGKGNKMNSRCLLLVSLLKNK